MARYSLMGSLMLQPHRIGLPKALRRPRITREVVSEEEGVMGIAGRHSRRGRGGGHRETARGRGGHHASNHHHGKNRHNKTNHNDDKTKAEAPPVGKKKKRKVNTLGLTPGLDSESEDDEGEEKALTDLIGTETLQISDVAAFLAERRKNYPTKARVEAKKAVQVAQKSQNKTAELEKQADKLRKQLAKVESSIKRKREQGDEGDEMRDPAENSSGDEKPEVMSSRVQNAAPPPAPATASAKKADVSRHCKYYSTGGTCGKKGKCRFVHDPEVREAAIKEREANNGRLTIQQRLILNDKEQEDLAVLQSIQYLRQKGLMMACTGGEAEEGRGKKDKGDEEEEQAEKTSAETGAEPALSLSLSLSTCKPSLLPAAPPSLPAPPSKRKMSRASRKPPPQSTDASAESAGQDGAKPHEGWLLQPYSRANGDKSKMDDLP
ncbi:hypothetical protein UVI_02054390 [Ustilaginoidea virens]|uniref:C3H1-type domain-containing protein n=1 Tax=Ustilaginoidea virens TaxID=1159556 RepID=A0A1B5L7A0_USTVR|nr:hypothetical protein UVI_02054390 [Ustilaginoidea virens]